MTPLAHIQNHGVVLPPLEGSSYAHEKSGQVLSLQIRNRWVGALFQDFILKLKNQNVRFSLTYRVESNLPWVYYQNERYINSKLFEFLQASSSSDYLMIAITETDPDNGVNYSEMFDENKYSTFRCGNDFDNTDRQRGGCVCSAIDAALKLLNLDIKISPTGKACRR